LSGNGHPIFVTIQLKKAGSGVRNWVIRKFLLILAKLWTAAVSSYLQTECHDELCTVAKDDASKEVKAMNPNSKPSTGCFV
jgi:hypothetical protein